MTQSGPDVHKTVEIPAVSPNDMSSALNDLRATVRDAANEVVSLRSEVADLKNGLQGEVSDLRNEVAALKSDFNEIRGRQDKNSLRAKGEAQTNLEQENDIDDLFTRVEGIGQKVDKIFDVATKVQALAEQLAKNPIAKDIVRGIGVAIVAWLASYGAQSMQAKSVTQPAPAVSASAIQAPQ